MEGYAITNCANTCSGCKGRSKIVSGGLTSTLDEDSNDPLQAHHACSIFQRIGNKRHLIQFKMACYSIQKIKLNIITIFLNL